MVLSPGRLRLILSAKHPDFGGDGALTAVLASWLNLYGGTVHLELTWTVRYHLVRTARGF
jgi:hypothetical protein